MHFNVGNQSVSPLTRRYKSPFEVAVDGLCEQSSQLFLSRELAEEDARCTLSEARWLPAAAFRLHKQAETNSVIETWTETRDTSRDMIREAISETAEHFGLTAEELTLAAQAARMAKEATRHTGVWSILHTLTPQQVVAVVENSTIGKLYRRFHELMEKIALPVSGFTHKSQADEAVRLVATHHELTKHQLAMGIDPTEKNDDVMKAERLRVAFARRDRGQKRRPEPSRGNPPEARPGI